MEYFFLQKGFVLTVFVCAGLDPARPGFDTRNSTGRLDASDALFVVGVHTGAGFVAMSEPVGHVDFYPNGGSKQPHCQLEDIPRE